MSNYSKISWGRALIKAFSANKEKIYHESALYIASYRPFCKENLYFHRDFNECVYKQPQLFPTFKHDNIVIMVPGVGSVKPFSPLVVNTVRDLDTYGGVQGYPLYWYEERKNNSNQIGLFDNNEEDKYIRHDGVTDYILKQAQGKYGNDVTKEDIFYYVYGILHSKIYQQTFFDDLKKMFPRIPLVNKTDDFCTFSNGGRDLAKLHLNYEDQAPLSSVKVTGEESNNFKVTKMKFKSKEDKSEIIYNDSIRITNIPAEAYEYAVNGKSAIDWIIERYQITVDKASGIKNDPIIKSFDHNKIIANPEVIQFYNRLKNDKNCLIFK